MPDTVRATGCSSWSVGADGQVEVHPWVPRHSRRLLAEVRPDDFVPT